jgi:hypothetical protein
MTETNPAYKIFFNRPAEIWRDGFASCDSVGRINYRMGLEFGPKLVCRLIKLRGLPDGDVFIQEENAKNPLSYYLESAYRLADLDTGNEFINMNHEMHSAFKNNVCNLDLLCRYLITPEGAPTKAGIEAADLYIATTEKSPTVSLSANQREGFIIVATTPERWNDTHGKTQNLMLSSGWVEMRGKTPVLTPLGQDIYERVVATATIQTSRVEPSESLIRSLKIIRDNSNEWGNMSGRVKGELKARGFVDIENKDYAVINTAGLEAIAEFKNSA